MNPMSCADYLMVFFNPSKRKETLNDVVKVLKASKAQYDGIVVTGVSGITMGSIASHLSGKPLTIVRKRLGSTCHSDFRIENGIRNGKYIFLDDQVSSGKTLERVLRHLKTIDAEVIGVIEYLYIGDPPRIEPISNYV